MSKGNRDQKKKKNTPKSGVEKWDFVGIRYERWQRQLGSVKNWTKV